MKKVGGIAGRRTGHQQHFDILVYSAFLSINNHIAYINKIRNAYFHGRSSGYINEYFKRPPQTITTGRTFSDLVTEFINNPRAMATILMIIPFVIFVANIKSVEYLKFLIITGIIFNLVWFGVHGLIKTINYITKRLRGA
ncbi:MAG: hypothetical protein KKI12_10965 [Proteobacteria bacterium]|nr:hypothetical protein [Pseudomonadota bacterium]